MEHKNLIIGLICIIAITGTLVFGFYHSASSKIISAKCDNSKRVCQVQNETSYFGGFSPHYYYYYIPYLSYGYPYSDSYYYSSPIIRSAPVCSNCLGHNNTTR